MRIVEFRIILPTNITQYQIGNLYMCAQRIRQENGHGEGVEILNNEEYTQGTEHGQYTFKIMHIKSKIPAAFRWAIPDKFLHVHEKCHNSYPHYHTLYEIPGLGEKFYLLIESQHYKYTASEGCPDNALGLTEQELATRKVVYLDIVNSKPTPDKQEWDMHGFQCPEAGINTALPTTHTVSEDNQPPEWTKTYQGEMMVCVKIVKFKFDVFGIQNVFENYVSENALRSLFIDSHRAMMKWAGEWFKMNMEDIRSIESQVQDEQKSQKFDRD